MTALGMLSVVGNGSKNAHPTKRAGSSGTVEFSFKIRFEMEFKERFLNAMLMCADMSRGTLWRVAEPVWIRNVEHYADKGRKEHVGLSIRNRPCAGVTDTIPMLIGTSKPRECAFAATGCFGPRSKRTTFFRFRPYQIPISDAYDEERGVMIRKNPYKSRLTAAELATLNRFLSNKGIIA